jgi:hypothetical protein
MCACADKLPMVVIINRHQSEDIEDARSMNVDEEAEESAYMHHEDGSDRSAAAEGELRRL